MTYSHNLSYMYDCCSSSCGTSFRAFGGAMKSQHGEDAPFRTQQVDSSDQLL